ncbi:hypothetical protein [Bradyrhizobium sp. CCBAU 21362]|uniref:hypothetical protein n=1 Tax=Bradyrhizobium sp. CCBAU 21362 TaxID=1325082 RepID=UPI0023055BA3|nr:hypothetical protein [Bradyrhizobium sp. CCBAU 21362]
MGIGSSAEVRDENRDRDMEAIWCGEFDGGHWSLKPAGTLLWILQGRPANFPLKIVFDLGVSHDAADAERSYRARLLNRHN